MGYENFYAYTGAVNKVRCTVQNYVFSDFNEGQSFQVFGFLNKEFDEVGWFYPSADSEEIDRYVVYDFNDNVLGKDYIQDEV